MSAIHTEFEFETEICADLAAAGWLYTPPAGTEVSPDAKLYDREHALLPADLGAWLQETQQEAWEKLQKLHGAKALGEIMKRLRQALDEQGLLYVLRNGFEMLGLRRPLLVAHFKPALAMNEQLQARYAANRLRVVRQVRYSLHHENCIDVVLFLNGIPVATSELKTDYTQAVEDAEYQYKKDRNPKVDGKSAREPLLSFPGGALVHFALSNSEVRMTTVLKGMDTRFIPFNQGSEGAGQAGGAGNPVNSSGFSTDYLWKQVWARESWLEILGRFVIPERNKKKQLTSYVFPRYHQLDCTRKLVQAVLDEGAGGKYLVQHSAGSGKTHSIAWTANFLADLHVAGSHKVFDSVIVISDRTVLDDQLQDAMSAHERTKGTVAYIKPEDGSKSKALTSALAADKKIIVCTLQTFPALFAKTKDLVETKGKRFAVIADEAHSSQTNESAATMKVLLSEKSEAEVVEIEEVSGEDKINDTLATTMAAKAAGKESGITFIGYTATPKDRTLQLFGTCPDPTRLPASDNIPRPFHVYSMRQAIEEGFILDVLQNYTPYKTAFQIAHKGDPTGVVVDEKSAKAGIMGWANLHEYNIAKHVEIVVEHFREFVEPLLNGQAKAMVVTASRDEAVRWHKATRNYIEKKGYKLNTLVAFSGEIPDPDNPQTKVTEESSSLNPMLKGKSIRKAFSSTDGQRGDYAILLVANKFQTGFDEPLLCGMYVHKRLDGIAAVQTLSRLNRAYPGKDTTYVVDFRNDPQEILAAFRAYYETAELAGVSDPTQVYHLRAKLDASGYYTDADVEAVAKLCVLGGKQSQLDAVLVPIANKLLVAYKKAMLAYKEHEDKSTAPAKAAKDEMDALLLFKHDMNTYVRLYTFLCQIFDYGNTDIEKRSIFYKLLHRLLTFDRDIETVDLSELALTHHTIKSLGKQAMPLGPGDPLQPTSGAGQGAVQDKHKEQLEAILKMVNDLQIKDVSDNDKLVYVNDVIMGKLLDCEILVHQAVNNTKDQFANSPDLDRLINDAIMDALASFTAMSKQALESAKIRLDIKEILLGPAGLYEKLKKKVEQP